MTENDWFNLIRTAEKVTLVGTNTRKIHYKLRDGRQMVEEYSSDTGVLCRRAFKNDSICKNGKWEVEIGDPMIDEDSCNDNIGIVEIKNSPYVIHRVTKTKLEWRIRNLPYESPVYQVTIDVPEKCIIVRTTNKKYYKKIPILELQRLNLTPSQTSLKFSYCYHTLIITYEKPIELISFEKEVQRELEKVQVVDNSDLDCKPS